MRSKFKALVFDLGGVLLEWDRNSINALTPGQFRAIMNTSTWHNLDRGLLTLSQACEGFANVLGVEPSTVETSLDQAQRSLTVNLPLVKAMLDVKEQNPDLKLYVMSNISREHFEIVQNLDLPWKLFTTIFVSGREGMRKPDICFFEHIIKEIGVHPNQIAFVDDTAENICAARSLGIHGLLVDNKHAKVGGTLRNLLQDPLPRAETFLKANAGNLHCMVEKHDDVVLKDNFAQLMIWELTGDADIVYLRYPSGELQGTQKSTNGHTNGVTSLDSDVNYGLWNYFYEAPILTTQEFPCDADTTSTAYLSLPPEYLSKVAKLDLVLDAMAENVDSDGIMQTYFDKERPRITPEVCCNILRVFHRYGRGHDARIRKTEEWVVKCLSNQACLDGNRHYSTIEGFLYYVARLYTECGPGPLKEELSSIKEKLEDRINVLTNPLALALRIAACQLVELDPQLYKKDFETFLALQDNDGGWPAGHFCCIGRTGARIGNRGLTTALAVKILRHKQLTA